MTSGPEGPAARAGMGSVARKSGLNVVGAAVAVVANFGLVLAVTRGTTKAEAGAVFTVTSIYLLIETIAELGTAASVVHFAAIAKVRRDTAQLGDVIWAISVPVVVASLVGGVIGFVALPPILHGIAGTVPHTTAVALVVAVAIPVTATYDLMTALTRGLGSARPTVVVERCLRPMAQIIAVVVVVSAHGGVLGITIAWLAPYVPAFGLMLVWALRLVHRAGVSLRETRGGAMFGPVWRFTLPRSLTSVVAILLQRLDIILVGAFLGAPAAAVYTGATRLSVVGQFGNQALAYAVQPRLASLVGQDNLPGARELYRVSTAWVVGLLAPFYITASVLAPMLVTVLGRRYQSGTSSMVIVALALLFGACCGLVDFVLITVGKTTWNLANSLLALAINVGVDVVLIPRIGIVGAAIGWAAAVAATNLIPVLQVRHTAGFFPATRQSCLLLIGAALAFGALPGVTMMASGRSVPLVAAAVLLGTAIYLAAIYHWHSALALDALVPRRRPSADRGDSGSAAEMGRNSADTAPRQNAAAAAEPSPKA